MKLFNGYLVLALLSLPLACGDQLVEFPVDGSRSDRATTDMRGPDVANTDSGSGDGRDSAAPADTATDSASVDGGGLDANRDVATSDTANTDVNRDVVSVDGGIVDVRTDVAGSDVSNTDAPRLDTGNVVDTGNLDTGNVVDAGNVDTGNLDTGSLDAGNLDAGNLDAGNLDGRNPDAMQCRQDPVVLGAAANFVVLAGPTVTNTGPTVVTGDLGTSPGTAVTGFGPGVVIGTQHVGNPTAALAQGALTTAYNSAAGRVLCPVTIAGNLGGLTLAPGLYKSTGSLEITSGTLVLDGEGDSNAVFIFQIASTLTTTSGRQIMLIRGARAINVFWQVGTSATLGSTSVFQGTLMADQAISLATGAVVNGRLLARIAGVSLDSNIIVAPTP